MASLVVERIQQHPLLAPLRAAGFPVLVSCHERAIFAQAISRGAGEYELEARIIYPEWWEPIHNTREDWALKIAGRLARNLRIQWDARDPDRAPPTLRGLGDR